MKKFNSNTGRSKKKGKNIRLPAPLRYGVYAIKGLRIAAAVLPILVIAAALGRLVRALSNVRLAVGDTVDDGSKRIVVAGGTVLVQSGASVRTVVAGGDAVVSGSVRNAYAGKMVKAGDPDVKNQVSRRVKLAEDTIAPPPPKGDGQAEISPV